MDQCDTVSLATESNLLSSPHCDSRVLFCFALFLSMLDPSELEYDPWALWQALSVIGRCF